ncbi:hypothetical protein NPIL_128531 [Nephila pilipes]|uniref:Uncharacterized protein n=1 Tax=Nephila pilipes TaxID=299642 RepID=A0A8X6R721_NEPPI|nr:hypothetical protein NPIL_128531 [Nephila pilipes]
MRHFNAALSSSGYAYYSHVGEIVEDYADWNGRINSYNEKDHKTFIHYDGGSTNLDIAMITPNLVDGCKKFEMGDPRSGYKVTLVTYISELNIYFSHPRPLWNF